MLRGGSGDVYLCIHQYEKFKLYPLVRSIPGRLVRLCTSAVLVKRRSIQHSAVCACNEIMRQMRAVVELQRAPSVRGVL